MGNGRQLKPFDLNLKLLKAQKMSSNQTQLTINAPPNVHLFRLMPHPLMLHLWKHKLLQLHYINILNLMARIASLPRRALMLAMLVSCFTCHEKPQPQAHLWMLEAITLWLQYFNGKI